MNRPLEILSDHEVAVSKRDLERVVNCAEVCLEFIEYMARMNPEIANLLIRKAEDFGTAKAAIRRVRNTLIRSTPEGI